MAQYVRVGSIVFDRTFPCYFFAFLYMGFGELGMSSWRAKHGRRGNVLPHGDDTLRALYCLRFCGCCVYSLITYENENATC